MAQPISFGITPEKEASKLQFLRRQFCASPPPVSRSDVDLGGKTAIVTGANGDIGLECSRQLLDLGLTKLIIAVRDEAKGEAARKSLTAAKALEPGVTINIWKLDYASYESITAFAQRAEKLSPRLDIAILNAGVNRSSFNLSPNTGHEEIVQTNYLSSVLLMLLLLRIFEKAKTTAGSSQSSPGRIVLVSSDTAAWAKFEEKRQKPLLPAFDQNSAQYDNNDRYATSKLLGQLFITELAKHVSPSVAIVNCANPGLCYSGLHRELGTAIAIGTRLIGRSPAVGARTFVHAATKLGESSHGQYVEDGKLRPMAPFVYSEEGKQVTQQLWKETMEELSFAGAQEIVASLGQA
ncbi:NAD(P)-binding protein [Whalleya microplaca]|nr:NAD(P)-binding protein [Whalleya microplaca]